MATSPTCPACSSPMRLRQGSFGKFWGCTSYPSCRKTVKFTETAPEAPADGPVDLEAAEAPAPVQKIPPPTYAEALANYNELAAKLDEDQRNVFAWTPDDGNTRVIAAAGSGKTTTTVALVAKLVREALVGARNIVATTFTSKAGKELAERLARVLPPGALDQMRVGTFHGIALRALRGQGGWDMSRCLDIGKRAREIPSSAKLWSMVLGYAGESGLPGTGAEGLGLEDPDIKTYQLAVDVARSHGLVGNDLAAALVEHEREHGVAYLARAWGMVLDVKRALGAWDFADALQAYWELLQRTEPTTGLVVFVDEAQDNSELQIKIAARLASAGQLVLVGDSRQAIYSWRGAFPELFVKSTAATRELRSNYRSGSAIVALGNKIAAGKDWSVGDSAVAKRDLAGTITVHGYADPATEAREVASRIKSATHDGAALDSFAVLCRTNAMSGAFEAGMIAAGLPCVVVGGTPFFKRYEVVNALAYIRLSVSDDLEAFARVVNKPRRYLGAKFVAQVSASHGSNLLEKIDNAIGRLNSRQRDAARELSIFLAKLRTTEWPARMSLITKLLSPVEADDAGEADADRSGLVAAVDSLAQDFMQAQAFLDFADQCAGEVIEAKSVDGGFELPVGRVTISTVHKAKGLEWPSVFVSASYGNFPHSRAVGPRYAEEERLFYVACTRAKDELHLTYSETDLRGNDAGPSPFLDYVDGGPDHDPQGGEPVNKFGAPAGHWTDKYEEIAVTPVAVTVEKVFAVPEGQTPVPLEQSGLALERDRSLTEAAQILNGELRQRPFADFIAATLAAPTVSFDAETPVPQNLFDRPEVVLFGKNAWFFAQEHAEAATAAEPAATEGEGGRFVQPTLAQFEQLLGSKLGFVPAGKEAELKAHQRVFKKGFAVGDLMVWINVYTTVDLGDAISRPCGEDSIKVAAVAELEDGRMVPLHKKLPYACRTRGWRVTLLKKLAELAPLVLRKCPRCGAPMAERKAMNGGKTSTFYGCVRWKKSPEVGCNGTMKA